MRPPRPSRILPSLAFALVTALGAVLLAVPVARAAVPAYVPKPPTWTSNLVTQNHLGVTDAEFAQWVQTAQTTRVAGFSFVATFTQCFGGGFLEELRTQGVTPFGANSAGRYWEPVSYHPAGANSYYSHAWAWTADNNGAWTDQKITDEAYDDTLNGGNGAIAVNPQANIEVAQYLSSVANPPPEAVGAKERNFAILFAGQPHPAGWDYNDLCEIYAMLTAKGYGAADIQVLYGNNVDPNSGDACVLDGAGTRANLQNAFAVWLPARFNMLDEEETVQVFFWAGDHGNADWPVTISVDAQSQGVAGDVNARSVAAQPVGNVAYQAGAGITDTAWVDPLGRDLDALSFGDDFQTPLAAGGPSSSGGGPPVYFSVDRGSQGLATTDVRTELAIGRGSAPDVFVATAADGNRQAFDGGRAFGLVDPPMSDETDALVMRNILDVADPWTDKLSRPLFFSAHGDHRVLVYDPTLAVGNIYVYWDPKDLRDLDALALRDDGMRVNQKLVFDPQADTLLLSVGRQENMAPWMGFDPCDVLRVMPLAGGGEVPVLWRSCQSLGLDPWTDNMDALDLGTGADGGPVAYPPYPPGPWDYPPYPDDEPVPDPDPDPVPDPQPEPDPEPLPGEDEVEAPVEEP